MSSLSTQLKKLPIFANFKTAELQEIIKNSFVKTLAKGEHLFMTNEKRDIFFILLAGEIGIVRKLGQSSQIVEIVTGGEYIAESALFDFKNKHSHTADVYSEKAVVLGLPGKLFPKLALPTRYKLLLNLIPLVSDNFSHASNRILTILKVGELLSTDITDIEILGTAILETLLQAIRANRALLVLTQADGQHAAVMASAGFKSPEAINNRMIDLAADPIVGQIIKEGKNVTLAQVDYLLQAKKVDYVTQSALGVPLPVLDKTIGALVLIDKKDNLNFNTNNEVLLGIIAKLVSLGLYQARQWQNQQAEDELKQKYFGL